MDEKVNKLTDKTFNRLLLTAVAGVLICIVLLCSSTYAWYSASISGAENAIKTSGESLLGISVAKGGENLTLSDGSLTLEKNATYTVTLTMPKDSPSGYCVITAPGGTYLTDYLERHDSDTPTEISFTLEIEKQLDEGGVDITTDTLTVSFKTHWGIYSGDVHVSDGETLAIK